MLILNVNDASGISTYTRMKDNEKLPIEFLVEGNFKQSLKAYQGLIKEEMKNPAIKESNLNSLGYQYLNNGNSKMAQDVFKVNMILYPNSSNAYHSYAVVCMKVGELDIAIENYKKSLSLDPKNDNAKKLIMELESRMQNKI